MFPYRLYGALPRVFVLALLIVAALALSVLCGAHAAARHHHRHHHAHHLRHPADRHGHALRRKRHLLHGRAVSRVFLRGLAHVAATRVGTAAEISVFGRTIFSAVPDEEVPGLFGLSVPAPFTGFSFDAGLGFLRDRVADIVRVRAQALGVPVRLALAITRYESGGRCHMRGRAGERGAMQVLPRTARSVGVTGNLYDCATGIEAGLRYLRLAVSMHAQAGWCAVASAYNSGTWQGSRCTHYGRVVARWAGLR